MRDNVSYIYSDTNSILSEDEFLFINEINFMTIHIKINDENVMTQNEVITIVFESLYRSMSLESVFILVSIYIATV